MPRAVNSAAWIPCSSGTFFSDTVGPRGGSGDEGGGLRSGEKKEKRSTLLSIITETLQPLSSRMIGPVINPKALRETLATHRIPRTLIKTT